MNSIESGGYLELLTNIKQRIRSAQYDALKAVNKELIALYWDIGKSIVEKQQHEGWVKNILTEVMENNDLPEVIREFQITAADSKNDFSETNIQNFMRFYLSSPSDEKLYALRRELAWSHYRMILPTEKELKAEFEAQLEKEEIYNPDFNSPEFEGIKRLEGN